MRQTRRNRADTWATHLSLLSFSASGPPTKLARPCAEHQCNFYLITLVAFPSSCLSPIVVDADLVAANQISWNGWREKLEPGQGSSAGFLFQDFMRLGHAVKKRPRSCSRAFSRKDSRSVSHETPAFIGLSPVFEQDPENLASLEVIHGGAERKGGAWSGTEYLVQLRFRNS